MNKQTIEQAADNYGVTNKPNWYEKTENPNSGKVIIIMCNESGTFIFHLHVLSEKDDWSTFAQERNVVRWAYFKDIAPIDAGATVMLEEAKTKGKKNDRIDGKVRMELLPFPELQEVARVLTAGAKKYGANNWQNLDDGYNRYLGAMLRHLTEVEKGIEIDADTGCLHIAQVACNALFMLHFKLQEYNDKEGGTI